MAVLLYTIGVWYLFVPPSTAINNGKKVFINQMRQTIWGRKMGLPLSLSALLSLPPLTLLLSFARTSDTHTNKHTHTQLSITNITTYWSSDFSDIETHSFCLWQTLTHPHPNPPTHPQLISMCCAHDSSWSLLIWSQHLWLYEIGPLLQCKARNMPLCLSLWGILRFQNMPHKRDTHGNMTPATNWSNIANPTIHLHDSRWENGFRLNR